MPSPFSCVRPVAVGGGLRLGLGVVVVAVLDHGFVRQVESWGSGDRGLPEAGIIEAARQSTAGSFRGWEWDKRLLRYLYEHKHSTPFEFAGLTIEVKAPIFVFRQWHRHRTQSYNEVSARYVELPCEFYIPSIERIVGTHEPPTGTGQAKPSTCSEEEAAFWQYHLEEKADDSRDSYVAYLKAGVPRELARLELGANVYSQMRATANLRNWLGFLLLRLDPHAQWEIRQFALAVGQIIAKTHPQTWALFAEGR